MSNIFGQTWLFQGKASVSNKAKRKMASRLTPFLNIQLNMLSGSKVKNVMRRGG